MGVIEMETAEATRLLMSEGGMALTDTRYGLHVVPGDLPAATAGAAFEPARPDGDGHKTDLFLVLVDNSCRAPAGAVRVTTGPPDMPSEIWHVETISVAGGYQDDPGDLIGFALLQGLCMVANQADVRRLVLHLPPEDISRMQTHLGDLWRPEPGAVINDQRSWIVDFYLYQSDLASSDAPLYQRLFEQAGTEDVISSQVSRWNRTVSGTRRTPAETERVLHVEP